MEIILKDPTSILSCVSSFSDEEFDFFITHKLTEVSQNSRFKQYFRYNPELHCNLIALIFKRVESSETISYLLKNDILFHRNFINEEKFRVSFLEIIFPTLIENLSKYEDQGLYLEICGIFKKVIFEKKSGEFQNYLEALLKISEKKDVKCEATKAILKTIGITYNSYPVCFSTCKIIVQSLVIAYKDFKLIYLFSIALLEVLGFDLTQDFSTKRISKYTPSEVELSKSLGFLSEIFHILKDIRIDLNSSIVINFSQFIENIVKSIINLTSSPNQDCYKILQYSIDIHPLLVEKNLNSLLTYSMFADNSKCEMEYTRFLMKIFETFTKLHRIQNLISKMLPIMKSIDEETHFEECYTFRGEKMIQNKKRNLNAYLLLPDEVLHYFSQCTMQMASWQYMNVLKTLIFHLDASVFSFVNSKEENSFIELLCNLTSKILEVDRINENTTTPKIMENFIASMGELKNILNKLGGALLEREHNQLLVRTFLELSYNWTGRMLYYLDTDYFQEEEIFFDITHPNYLFSFLTNEQWILLSQRIMNFGESKCKHLMLILTVKKLTVMQMSGNQLEEEVQHEAIHQITTNMENACEYIIFNKFISQHLVHKLDSDVIMNICDHLLGLVDIEPNIVRDIDSEVWRKAMCFVLLKKISKILSKGKSNSASCVKKLLSTANEGFYDLNLEDDQTYFAILKKIFEENLWISCGISKEDSDNRLELLSKFLMQLNISHFPPKFKALVLLILLSLHKHYWGKMSELKNILEDWLICTIQSLKLDCMELLDPESLFKNVSVNFTKKEEFFLAISQMCLINEDDCKRIVPGIEYLLKNPDNTENLKCTLVFFRNLKKLKNSEFCLELKERIINVNYETVNDKEPDISLIPSYGICLKHYMVLEETDKLKKLTDKLEDYFNIILEMKNDDLPKGSTLLFSTVIPNKHCFIVSQDLPLRLWLCCKTKRVDSSETQEFSKLISLIFEHIQNNKFHSITSDFLNTAVESIHKQYYAELSKHLQTGIILLTTSLNTVKFEILQKMLEEFMMELHVLKTNLNFDQKIFNEIMQFEIAVINRKLLPISPGMMSILLISSYVLLEKGNDFYKSFNMCTNHMECLLKHRSHMIMDRISTYLKVFRCLLSSLCNKCGDAEKTNNLNELEDLTNCAHQLEKIARHLVRFKRDMESIACYLIGDILFEYESYTLFPRVKVHLNNCIYSLLSLCDQHAISYLLRVLSSASRELFKEIFDKYKKRTFKGKV